MVKRVQLLITGLHDATHSVKKENSKMQSGIKTAGRVLLVAFVAALTPLAIHAQNIGWEGETGVFVTPLAYTVSSPAKGFSLPTVGFHFLATGNVIGDFYETSITMGALKRTEFGYTRNFLSQASDPNRPMRSRARRNSGWKTTTSANRTTGVPTWRIWLSSRRSKSWAAP